ncbi:DUF1206 domain-containing protein [Aurantiacibacter suaedae]|uniref:DUF1206 domain-containing protein n=1 Tax=Aurantiacibacter suaedae TaxID=2545755 RepID=UPI001F50043E|nr:DUF1206 domain-containing protein [Aurantiacibacter suaedae]
MMVDKSEKFEWLVRVGYFSRAILYAVLGLIALTSAGQISRGTEGIFAAVENFAFGQFILWIMVVGLCAYALFRLASTFFDIEHNGSDTKGWAKRIGHAGSAIGHFALAWTAYEFATGPGSGGGGAQDAAAGLMSMSFGPTLLGLLGIAFGLTALFQLKKAISGEFMHRVSSRAPSATRWLGGLGYGARAVVYGVIGWSLAKVGFMSGGSDQVKTLGDAVASLADEGAVFTITALGLLMFGLFSLVLARYRIIPELDLDRKVPEFRA